MRDAEKDLAMCEKANDGLYAEGWLVYTEYADSPDDSGLVARCVSHELANFLAEAREALPHWIQRAVAAEEEAKQFREALEKVDIHIRSTSDPVPYIIETLKSTLPEYKDWWDIGE